MFLLNIYTKLIHLIKTKISHILTIIGAFLVPIVPLMLIVGLMIALDTATGLIKARKLKEKITSRKLSNVISKMGLYQVGIITIFILNQFILNDIVLIFTSVPLFLVKVTAIFFAGIELVSINENVQQATGLNLFAKFKELLKRAISVKKDLKGLVKDEDETKIG